MYQATDDVHLAADGALDGYVVALPIFGEPSVVHGACVHGVTSVFSEPMW